MMHFHWLIERISWFTPDSSAPVRGASSGPCTQRRPPSPAAPLPHWWCRPARVSDLPLVLSIWRRGATEPAAGLCVIRPRCRADWPPPLPLGDAFFAGVQNDAILLVDPANLVVHSRLQRVCFVRRERGLAGRAPTRRVHSPACAGSERLLTHPSARLPLPSLAQRRCCGPQESFLALIEGSATAVTVAVAVVWPLLYGDGVCAPPAPPFSQWPSPLLLGLLHLLHRRHTGRHVAATRHALQRLAGAGVGWRRADAGGAPPSRLPPRAPPAACRAVPCNAL